MDETKTPIAAFTTNSFVGNPYAVIIMAISSGMTLMFLGIMSGMPVIISMILLFGGILGVYGFGIGKVYYAITDTGIEQHIRRFIPYQLWGKKEKRFFPFSAISSYKNDTDRTRSGGEYEFLKLYLKKSPGEIWITNQHDDAGFQKFKEAFFTLIKQPIAVQAQPNEQVNKILPPSSKTVDWQATSSIASNTDETKLSIPIIKERKSFYETFFAKLLTIFFTLLTIFLVWILAFNGMRFTNWFRVLFIILPGTVYMIYRVFISPRINRNDPPRYNK